MQSHLLTYRKAHVSFTKQNADKVLPVFLKCLENLPNLHTIKVVFAPLSMTTTIKSTFEKASLPTIRTVVVPAYCHEILRACPEVRSVWCMEEDGGKLVAALGKGKCGKVEELRGCSLTHHMMKRTSRALSLGLHSTAHMPCRQVS
jgi:hypothetical protein